MRKIAIINKSDLRGGAAIATYRLMNALRHQGADATMLVTERLSNDPNVVSYANPIADRFHFLAERAQIFTQNGFSRDRLFKVDTADWGRDISRHPVVKNADAIILNWVNQGALSLDGVERLCATGKPVIWTMHDMWNCTGICHHAYDCTRFHGQCGYCPYLASSKEKDLSHRSALKKQQISEAHNLHFVAVSSWLKERCNNSFVLHNKNITVIPNTTNVEDYSFKRLPNANYNIPKGHKVITMGAARLDDEVKGITILLSSLKWLKAHRPDVANQLHLILFGGIRDASLLLEIDIPYTYLGHIHADKVKEVMAHSDVVLSSSLYESFGETLIEGQAAGCVPVTFGKGGQADIVTHLQNGYIAEYMSPEDFARGIEWAINADIERKTLHEEMKRRFSPSIVAKKYLSLLKK